MLTTIQGRVLGCLLEKERTTPDQYPLTLNALVLACNQSTSRDPVMHLVDHEVETVLAGLKSETLLRYVHPSHGRSVTRYRQVADEAWALDPPAAALVAVLLLRGPQTVAELRTRTERMHAFESPEAVETVLRELSLRGSVQLLGERSDRLPARGIARRGLGRTFQHVHLVSRMSVLDNVKVGCHSQTHAGFLRSVLRASGVAAEEKAIEERARLSLIHISEPTRPY